MKRDMDLVRDLLLKVEEGSFDQESVDDQLVVYHLRMLSDQNFVSGLRFLHGPRIIASVRNAQLTWVGHEFLDTVRSKTIWDRIKKVASDKGVDLSWEAIKLVSPQVLAAALK